MRYFLAIMLLLLTLYSCRQAPKKEVENPVEKEKVNVMELEANKMKVELQEIWRLTQKNNMILTDSIEANFGAGSQEAFAFWKKLKQIDSLNFLKVENIIAQNGWPKISVVGREAAAITQQIILKQGAKGMEKYLPLLKDAYMQKEADGLWVAEWEDKILMENKLPQLYGTQEECEFLANGERICKPYKIDDIEQLDERRRNLGLESFAEFADAKGWKYN